MTTRRTISKVTVTNNDNLVTIRACPSLCSAGLFRRQIMFSVYLCACHSQTDTPTRLFFLALLFSWFLPLNTHSDTCGASRVGWSEQRRLGWRVSAKSAWHEAVKWLQEVLEWTCRWRLVGRPLLCPSISAQDAETRKRSLQTSAWSLLISVYMDVFVCEPKCVKVKIRLL